MERFICWLDEHGNRGYIPQSTAHTLLKVNNGLLYLEAPGVAANMATDADIFIVAKLEHAINWVKTGNDATKIAETCAEKGV